LAELTQLCSKTIYIVTFIGKKELPLQITPRRLITFYNMAQRSSHQEDAMRSLCIYRAKKEDIVIVFRNLTKKVVDVYWSDYEGNPIMSTVLTPYETTRHVWMTKTSANHTWTFANHKTTDRLLGNRELVFRVPPTRTDQVVTVSITTPVYTLQELCLQVVRDNVIPVKDFLNKPPFSYLPKSLIDDIMIVILKKDRFYL